MVSALGSFTLAGGNAVDHEENHGINIRFDPNGSPLMLGDRFTIDVGYYQGDQNNLNVNVNQGSRVGSNITGDQALGANGAPDNIIDTLSRLAYALRKHDTGMVSAELPHLNDALDQLTSQTARAGVRLTRNQFTYQILGDHELSSTQRMSRFEDVDFEEAITNLQTAQTAYQATLASTSMITKLSLVDYIR
jgi:flagellar hook-associated protein 3 FlgL